MNLRIAIIAVVVAFVVATIGLFGYLTWAQYNSNYQCFVEGQQVSLVGSYQNQRRVCLDLNG